VRRRIWIIALWLAATCPFVANYSAVVLTETLVTFLATAALCCFARALGAESQSVFRLCDEQRRATPFAFALLGAALTGLATLVRPEMPLLLGVAAAVLALRWRKPHGIRRAVLLVAAMSAAFLVPLLPWAARNLVTLKEVQFVAPRYATLPEEYAPVGYYAWTATWLERYRDSYLSLWKIGEEPIDLNDIPLAAFDSPEERAHVAELIDEYNGSADMEISPQLDGKFAEIARARTHRHPLRTYVTVPLQRALSIWFTPRTELFDIDGKFWPLREQWRDSRVNVVVTGSFALLGYLYVGLAVGGVWFARRTARGSQAAPPATAAASEANLWAIALILAYFVVRTSFLTTVEAPEPRYVVSCYPALLALVALLGI
jgi:4-amino-4-deoxy-L-arabinose transferase-like glycosyltransferase